MKIVYIILLMFTFGLCHPANGNPAPSATQVIEVSQMPFAGRLRNVCGNNLQWNWIENSAQCSREVISNLILVASNVAEEAEAIISSNMLGERCSTSLFSSVPINTSAIINGSRLEALRIFYKSLLKYTARVILIPEQVNLPGEVCYNPDLNKNAAALGIKMESLLCVLRYCTLPLQSNSDNWFDDAVNEILTTKFSNPYACEKRSIRDCKTLKDTATVGRELVKYFENKLMAD